MQELPSGTVTMLFSDIEGSTALLSRLGDRYAEALSAQRAVLRGAIGASHGHELGTEGDSFFVVFGSAGDAVRCCVAAQLALACQDWPDGAVVRVRMGLHSGEPIRHEDGYIGMDVHRAARIAATAHGGQVVLSDATRRGRWRSRGCPQGYPCTTWAGTGSRTFRRLNASTSWSPPGSSSGSRH
jgi:class 3 adenylate cyclase